MEELLEKQEQMLLFLSYSDQSIQSRTYGAVIKHVRDCGVLKLMQLSLLCVVGSFIIKNTCVTVTLQDQDLD